MQKIIELAERVCNARTPFVTSDLYELDKVIGERKELESTPIAEEWLKEHGWNKTGTPYEWKDGIFVQRWNLPIKIGFFEILYCKYNGYTWRGVELTSVARLIDACELCGIEL